MTPRVCGTCRFAKHMGGGQTVCTHPGGRFYGVTTTSCRQPRRWWEPRAELIREEPEAKDGQLTFAL